MSWRLSHRADRAALPLADRHYNRQKPGTPQFVPPGRCFVLLSGMPADAVWVTSWPFAAYTKHAWAGAWVNSLFRKECDGDASAMIRAAVSATRAVWPAPPLGMVTFVDPEEVRPITRRGRVIFGYCYLKAGFHHVGFTKGGLWVWQMLPHEMPEAREAFDPNAALFQPLFPTGAGICVPASVSPAPCGAGASPFRGAGGEVFSTNKSATTNQANGPNGAASGWCGISAASPVAGADSPASEKSGAGRFQGDTQ